MIRAGANQRRLAADLLAPRSSARSRAVSVAGPPSIILLQPELRLACCGLAALAAGCLLLGGRAALLRVRARGRVRSRLLAAATRGARRVGDPRRPLLRHSLFLQLLVLLLVLAAGALVRHESPFPYVCTDRSCRLASASNES